MENELGLWWKAGCGMRHRLDADRITGIDIALYYLLMEESKIRMSVRGGAAEGGVEGGLEGVLLPSKTVQGIASSMGLKTWRKSLARLEADGLVSVEPTGVRPNWAGQETTRDVLIKRATRSNGSKDIAWLHEHDIHEFCRKRGRPDDCPHATEFAKEKDESARSPRGKRATSEEESDPESDQTQSSKSDVDGMTEGKTSSRPGSRPRRSPSVVVSGEEGSRTWRI